MGFSVFFSHQQAAKKKYKNPDENGFPNTPRHFQISRAKHHQNTKTPKHQNTKTHKTTKK